MPASAARDASTAIKERVLTAVVSKSLALASITLLAKTVLAIVKYLQFS
jgi:hypothetical protein